MFENECFGYNAYFICNFFCKKVIKKFGILKVIRTFANENERETFFIRSLTDWHIKTLCKGAKFKIHIIKPLKIFIVWKKLN